MEHIGSTIQIHYTNNDLNELLKNPSKSTDDPYTRHFSQNEDFFLKLETPFTVPSFPIHHDIQKSAPSDDYLASLTLFLNNIVHKVPEMFANMTYFFNPADTLNPSFFQLFKVKDSYYLYLMKIDLIFRTHNGEIITRGTNDRTPEYETTHLFVHADMIPLEDVPNKDGKILAFQVYQTISQTWIGETGRGYFVQGIWMDNELTKFFSKLFLPKGKRTYPYYPFSCKYRTLCHTVLDLNSEGRKVHLPYLHKALEFMVPVMDIIQKSLRNEEFNENLPIFQQLKAKIPDYWTDKWDTFNIRVYLNENDLREYAVDV